MDVVVVVGGGMGVRWMAGKGVRKWCIKHDGINVEVAVPEELVAQHPNRVPVHADRGAHLHAVEGEEQRRGPGRPRHRLAHGEAGCVCPRMLRPQ